MQFKPVESQDYALPNNVTVTQQFDEIGRHRLVINNHAFDSAGYSFIAFAETHEGFYGSTTEYHGMLPRVFEIRAGKPK
jgi:hypothetical protein